MNRWMNQALIGALVLAVGGVGFWLGRDARPDAVAAGDASTKPSEGESAAPVASVKTMTLQNGTVAKVVDAYGTVQAIPGSSATVSVPFEAIVQRVLVTPGTVVAASTPVLAIGPTAETQLQLRQANDAVAAADRNLEDVRRRLSEQLATNADVLTAEQAQQTAKTALASLQQRGIGEPREIAAGAAGVVGEVNVTAGQVVAAGAPLITIASDKQFEAVLGLEPTNAGEAMVGDAVQLRDVHAAADAPSTAGTIRLIAPQVNPQTHLQEVSVTLPPESKLPLGTFVTGELEIATATGLAVPRSAVIPDDEDSVLFVVHDEKAVRHVVKITLAGSEQLLVTGDDLHVGDEIVVDGNAELEDGMAVSIEPDVPASQPSTAPATEAP